MTFKGYYYKEYLSMFGNFKFFPKETDPIPEGLNVYLRHDMDGKPENALRMAYIEYELGVKSTYFVLNHTKYWENPAIFDLLREIQLMGHEIAWHQCVIVQKVLNPDSDIKSLITEPLKRLRDEGLLIRGTSPHGSKVGADNNINSWQIWKEYGLPYKDMPTFSFAEFGLEYEAMHLFRNNYHSDSSNQWNGDPKRVADALNTSKDYVLQINIHPQWWD